MRQFTEADTGLARLLWIGDGIVTLPVSARRLKILMVISTFFQCLPPFIL
ncbi:MAG: hypothetical protein ACLFWI_09080 [Coleofasciculus sp.]